MAIVGRDEATRTLKVGAMILERAADPYELLQKSTIDRLSAALDALDRTAFPDIDATTRTRDV